MTDLNNAPPVVRRHKDMGDRTYAQLFWDGSRGPRVVQRGAVITTGVASAYAAIPDTSTGEAPDKVRLAATAACYVRLGEPLEATVADSAKGTGYQPLDTITLTGGTFDAPMVLRADTVALVGAVVDDMGAGFAKDDVVTLDGGTAVTPAEITVATLQIADAESNAAGTGYAPGNVATLAGGTFSTAGQVTVDTTKVVSATVAAGGADGADGVGVIVEGTTGTGTKFQASVTVTDGAIASVQSISLAGAYSVNPTAIAVEPVTAVTGGAGLTGAQLDVVMGVDTFTITTRGNYTIGSDAFTQNGATVPAGGTGMTLHNATMGVRTFTVSDAGEYSATSATLAQDGAAVPPGGTGLTVKTAAYGVETATVIDGGDYTIDPANPVAQGATSGAGAGASFNATMVTAAAAGDMLWPAGRVEIIDAKGFDHVAAVQVSGAGVLQVSPVENLPSVA